jgi:ribosomal protein S18 acetylase RimI-like enzyme
MNDNVQYSMDSIKIAKPSVLDLFLLLRLFNKAVNEEYSIYNDDTKKIILKRHSFLHLLIARGKPNRTIFMSIIEQRCVGVCLGTTSDDGVGVINWIYVLPKYRNMNIARKMLEVSEKEFERRNCHKLLVTTEVAQDFYRKIGYKEEAVLKKHWWGKDFYYFSKLLGS